MFKNNTKGFTLIELLVVIAIIGILSTIALSSMTNARKKANDASFKSAARSAQSTIVMCFDDAVALNTQASSVSATKICGGTNSSYASYVPVIGVVTVSGHTATMAPVSTLSTNCTSAVCDTEKCTFFGC